MAIIVLACVVVGAVLIWRGFRYSRGLMLIFGALLGLAMAGPIYTKMDDATSYYVILLIMIPVGAILGFVLARLTTGILVVVLAGGGTLFYIITENKAQLTTDDFQAFDASEADTPVAWLAELVRLGRDYVTVAWDRAVDVAWDGPSPDAAWNQDALIWVGILIGVAIVAGLMALLLSRISLIVLTSFLGSVMLILAWALGAMLFGHTDDPTSILTDRMALPFLAGLMLVGILVQSLNLHTPKKTDSIPTAKPAEK